MLSSTDYFSFIDDRAPYEFLGRGYLAGAYDGTSPIPQDGRAKILNEPARVKVKVFELKSMRIVASTLSTPAGLWKIEHLDPERMYTVIGLDGSGRVNSAIQDYVKPHVPEP